MELDRAGARSGDTAEGVVLDQHGCLAEQNGGVAGALSLAQPLSYESIAVEDSRNMQIGNNIHIYGEVNWLQLKALSNDDDIPYNLLVGGDGLVYEGRGWSVVGATLPDWDSEILSLALIGNFDHASPTEQQRAALASLLQWGVSNGKVDKAYRLAGACQLREYEYFNDTSPGVLFMPELQTWDHWWDFM
ncbi:peptidoglycan-recognition protein, partial [Frankliniella occidentalis]